MLYSKLAKPFLFQMDAEKAHHLVIDGLHTASQCRAFPRRCARCTGCRNRRRLRWMLFGLHFPHPIGLAAGRDWNAKSVDMFSNIGFGFVEVGTVTPRAKPVTTSRGCSGCRADQALVNRMGFNNDGAGRDGGAARQVRRWRRIPVAVNIGKKQSDAERARS